jgi:hypothetical protein
MQCFCGCGQRAGFGVRGVNKRGERLRHDVHRVEQLLRVGMVSLNATAFVEQANEWCEVFADSVHAGTKPDDYQPGLTQTYFAWLREVRPFVGQYGVAYLGKSVRGLGLSRDESMGRITAGDFDPYESVQMPIPNDEGASAVE